MGSKIGFLWVYCIILFFLVGIMEMVLMPAITHKLAPTLEKTANMTLSPHDAKSYTTKVNTTINFMHNALYVVLFVVFLYALVSVFKREENEPYQP